MSSDSTAAGNTSLRPNTKLEDRAQTELEARAIRLAQKHQSQDQPDERLRLLKRLQTIRLLIHDEYLLFARLSELDETQSYAAEWILDNYYIIQQAVRQIEEDMPEKFYRELPTLSNTSLAGFPRVYAIANDLVNTCEARLTADDLESYVEAYQSVLPLKIGEVWALPVMFRFTLLEALARAATRALDIQTLDERALGAEGTDESSADTIVAHAVSSLRAIAVLDWQAFFERTSLVEGIFRQDPAGIYPRMDFRSRDSYRKVVEDLAKKSGTGEVTIASQAVHLAQDASQGSESTARRAHVGYYLIDRGLHLLEAQLDYQPAGWYRIQRWVANHPTVSYLGPIAVITVGILGILFGLLQAVGASILQQIVVLAVAVVSALFLSVNLVNGIITRTQSPRLLPKLDFNKAIPADCSTLVVIPALLTDIESDSSLLHQLELHYLRNQDDNLAFALLTDFSDAPQQHMPDDEDLLAHIVQGIEMLRERYQKPGDPERFFLLHRSRKWNPVESIWMGWERKRGKLEELNLLLLEQKTNGFSFIIGDPSTIQPLRYVLTLDADTLLPQGSAADLIGTLAHPLCQAEFDPQTGQVTAGYTVLQPRTEIKPGSALRTRFSTIYAGETAIDLYTLAVSDVYQDLFGEGIFVGKGIYDLQAFHRSLAGKIPENRLLSHDLLEGLLGRAGLVSDVVLYEEFPPAYLAYNRRMHRWIRGDWQLLPWLLMSSRKARNDVRLSLLDRWKIIDNLRRSLHTPSILLLFLFGWFWLPVSPYLWTLLVLFITFTPLLVGIGKPSFHRLKQTLSTNLAHPELFRITSWLLSLAFLINDAATALSAIITTLWRLLVSHRKLLEWTTSARVEQLFEGSLSSKEAQAWRSMALSPIIALVILVLLLAIRPLALPAALPLLALWITAPQLALWSREPATALTPKLKAEDTRRLHNLARRTWYFFEQFVGPTDHWIPPDHFQEVPRGTVAHRTSPTNIGLGLLSTLASYDLGYTDLQDMVLRVSNAITTLDQMQMYRGHWLNWYDTRSLDPLPPRYISTVDSGNLAAAMLCLRQGMRDVLQKPFSYNPGWDGLFDTITVFQETLESLITPQISEPMARSIQALIGSVNAICSEIDQKKNHAEASAIFLNELSKNSWSFVEQQLVAIIEASGTELESPQLRSLRVWAERVRYGFTLIQREQENRMPWLAYLINAPGPLRNADRQMALGQAWENLVVNFAQPIALAETGTAFQKHQEIIQLICTIIENQTGLTTQQREEALSWCHNLSGALDTTRAAISVITKNMEDISERLDQAVQKMDFTFLLDPQRNVFHIGYNLDNEHMDANYYDLLASEARIASLLAIAKHDIPLRHWMHLGRPVVQVENKLALLSWSGTMFEYLMPSLLMRDYPNTLLTQSAHAAVSHQIAYGVENGVPWGISESGFYFFDAHQNYQYRAFGVPGLGFKRGLSEDLVITPYASLLALPYAPVDVVRNMAALDALQMRTDYGYYEAVDFTPERMVLGQRHAIVRSFMSHHQGMILLQLANTLLDQIFVNRYHNSSRIQSVEILLQEQIPEDVPLERLAEKDEEPPAAMQTPAQELVEPWRIPAETAAPSVHYLSNGSYSLLITNKGSGYSRWQGTDLTRWRADATLDDWGTWIYIQDQDSGELFTATPHMDLPGPGSQEIFFAPHRIDFHTATNGLNTHLMVAVSPDEDVEVRQLRLSNQTDRPRFISISSYGEVVLTSLEADRRHPAFNKLLIESEWRPEQNALIFHRRPYGKKETPVYFLHMLIPVHGQNKIAYETNRLNFLGRGRSFLDPAGLQQNQDAQQASTGYVLDPIFSLGQQIQIPAHSAVEVTWVTLAAGSRQKALELAHSWQNDPSRLERVADQARYASEVELRRLGIAAQDVALYQKLLSVLFYPQALLRADPAELAKNVKGQPGLWAYGISGDYPILLVRASGLEDTPLLRDLLRAHKYWRSRGLQIDLVIINEKEAGYSQEVHNRIFQLLLRTNNDSWLNQRGGIFLLRWDSTSPEDQVLLNTTARAILSSRQGSLAEQIPEEFRQPMQLPAFIPVEDNTNSPAQVEPTPLPSSLLFANGLGGFSEDGAEYNIYLEPGQSTPAPWINVIANEQAGFWVSESGGGYTWALNSGENRLTPWHNDPVTDMPGEVVYIRDEETAEVWSPTPLPAGADTPYRIRHGNGYTLFEHHSHGLRQQLRLFMDAAEPVKFIQLRLENTHQHTRRITVTCYAEWVLGVNRDQMAPYILPGYDADHFALTARNPYQVEFGERVAFLAASKEPHGITADRTEFLGRTGSYRKPAALSRVGLSGVVAAGLDPCAALMVHLDILPGEAQEIYFLLGQGANQQDSQRIIEKFQRVEAVNHAFQQVRQRWERLLETVQVKTPNPEMDMLLNRWLLYQDLSCRIWGRSALYQSSGAFGFRDQLQDVMALFHAAPQIARAHILDASTRQFDAGDVLHWWHPPSGRGVRTRHSDDMLWLPFVVLEYITATGDRAILEEQVPFLTADELSSEEEDRYGQFPQTEKTYTIYEHCRRAILRGSTRGPHQLPLMGTGDWNDGMNRVGDAGIGESIWLGWFLYAVLTRFTPVCRLVGDEKQAVEFQQQAAALRQALQQSGWDGEWYLRGYYDDGTPLGSRQNLECKIDSIAQSWAVLSGGGDPDRNRTAIRSIYQHLVQEEGKLVRLFRPAFNRTPKDPGYIKSYPPGVRENGGQYTHAAIWAVWAYTLLEDGDTAGALFDLLNPIRHSNDPGQIAMYRVEPYVIAADVYSEQPHTGRGGWTWYTGSGGWLYRLGIEAILGLKKVGSQLIIDPCIPSDWEAYSIQYRFGDTLYQIEVQNPDRVSTGVSCVSLDGQDQPDRAIPLVDDQQTHQVVVQLGADSPRPEVSPDFFYYGGK